MTPTQQFIEDAIAGGYFISGYPTEHEDWIEVYQALLSPLAWQAVGKTRGWKEERYDNNGIKFWPLPVVARRRMHDLIDHLADGKTIDEALAAISQGV